MIDIKGRYEAEISRRREVWPQHTNRASSLGHPCERYLTYSRTQNDKRELPSVGLQAAFEDGHLHEEAVLDVCRKAGLRVTEQQRDLGDDPLLKAHQITGHIDALIADGDDGPYPFDVKSCNSFAFRKLDSIEDMKRHRSGYVQAYPGQIQLYMLGRGIGEGGFLLKDKGTSAVKQINASLDYAYAEDLIQKADRINAHVAAGTLPEPINEEHICRQCPFRAVCPTDVSFGAPLSISDDPELIAMLELRESLSVAHKEYEAVDKRVKEAVKGVENALVGRFHVSGKDVPRKGYTVEATTYWLPKIVPLEGSQATVDEAA